MDINPHFLSHCEVVNLKITGWSVKQTGTSLLCTLGKLGNVACFIHYPEIQTCYVAAKVLNRMSVIDRIKGSFPNARVEPTSPADAKKSERAFESAHLTAVLSSHSLFTETEVYFKLSRFGRIRVLECFRSIKSGKYFCKVSFYESHCLEEFLSKSHSIAFQSKSDRSPRNVNVARLLPKVYPKQKKAGCGVLLNPNFADKVSSQAHNQDNQFNCRNFKKSNEFSFGGHFLEPATIHTFKQSDAPILQLKTPSAFDFLFCTNLFEKTRCQVTNTCSSPNPVYQCDTSAVIKDADVRELRFGPASREKESTLSSLTSNRRSKLWQPVPNRRFCKKKNSVRSASQGQAPQLAVKKIFQSDDKQLYNQLKIRISKLRERQSTGRQESLGRTQSRSRSCLSRTVATRGDRNLLKSLGKSSDNFLGLLSFLELDCGEGRLGKLPVHTGVASKSSDRGCVRNAPTRHSYLSLGEQSDGITVSEEFRNLLNELNNIKQGTTRPISTGGLVVSHFKFQLTNSTEAVSSGTPVFTEHSDSTHLEGRLTAPSPRRQYICPQTQSPLCVQYFTVPGL